MGLSQDYPNVPDWVDKSEGYQTGSMVKYQGNIFYANFWATEPGVGDPNNNGWRFYDELYDLTPHNPTEQAKIIAYIPTWRKVEGFNYANDEMYQYITHGIIAFLMFSEINLGEFEPNSVRDVYVVLSDIVNTGHQKGTKILIALGGATDYGFLNLMTFVGNNPEDLLLDRSVQNVVNFVNLNNLDGVDLDLECWWDKDGNPRNDHGGRQDTHGEHPAGRGLSTFARKLKEAMPDKSVSAAFFATSWYGNNYQLLDYVDWIGIMTYDLTGSWNNSPVGPHTALYKIRNQENYQAEQQGEWPLPNPDHPSDDRMRDNPIHSLEDSLWYWTNPLFVNWQSAGQNMPRNKMAGGVPIYGYDFAYAKDPDDLSGQIAPGYKVVRYKDILAQFPNAYTAASANFKIPGSTPSPSFVSASDNYPYAHNIYFETPETAVAKLNFLKDVGTQGVIIWELSNDVWEEGKSIIKALYRNSGNPEFRPALPGKTSVPSDILTPFIFAIESFTNEFAAEIAEGREKETSRLGLLVEPSLLEPIERFFASAGKPNGKEIKREDAIAFIGWWTEIEKKAREYKVDSPGAPNQIKDLKSQLDRLFQQVESKSQGEDGWLFVPLLSMISLFQAHILLEWFVRQNPSKGQQSDTDNDDEDEEQKECEREADEVVQQIQRAIDVLKGAFDKWPSKDLGPVGLLLSIPTPPAPTPTPPTPTPPKPPTRLPSSNPFFVKFADGMLFAEKNRGINLIARRSIPSTFSRKVFTVFEIQSQEGCNMAMETYKGLKEIQDFLSYFIRGPIGWILRLPSDNDVLTGDWTYQVGDRLFTYATGGGGWASSTNLYVFKRNGQIYYQGDLLEDMFPKFQEYFNINPLSVLGSD